MKWLALIAAAGLALAGCGSSHESSPPPRPPHYPVVVHSPAVERARLPVPPAKPPAQVSHFPQVVSRTRLAIITTGSSSCPSVPDELVVLSRHAIRIHLTVGSWERGELVAHPPPGGVCTADLGTTRMLVAIDPTLIDVHQPLTVHLFYHGSKKPIIQIAAPLKS